MASPRTRWPRPLRPLGRRAIVALVVPAVLVGCTPATPREPTVVAGTTSTTTLEVDGRLRTYHVHLPAAALDAGAVPLVVVLHGGIGSGRQAQESYGWDEVADREGFAVAYPDGLQRAWNVGSGCCGRPGREGVDDVAFVVSMVEALSGRTHVDPQRVYATGISNGGMLAYRLACDTAVLAAIGPDSATLLGPCPSPAPVSVIHLHGTADTSIRYAGGRGEGVARIDGPAVPAVVDLWRSVDGCAPPTTTMSGAVTRSVASCPGGHVVELVTIEGAGHQWPGAEYSTAQRLLGLDPPSTELSATESIWSFFAAHPRPPG